MWHFDDSGRHGLIYQISFWGNELEILQHITSGKVENLYLTCPMVAEIKRTVLTSIKFWLLFC